MYISNYIPGIAMSNNTSILVTGAAGNVGSVGRGVVKLLRERDLPVRALVHRLDERSQARVISTILEDPTSHQGKVYELTGPRSEDMNEIAKEYALALSRPVRYVYTPYDKWLKETLLPLNFPQHLFHHVSAMAKLIAENRYDRLTSDVQKLTGKPSMSVREYVTGHPEIFSN